MKTIDRGTRRLLPGLLLPIVNVSPSPGADITFFGYSDCHFEVEYVSGVEMVDRINNLPGTAYPPAIGGAVAVPKGIIMAGDLIDDGAVDAKYPTQWSNYRADFGVNGEGRVKFPVYEGVGNHDMHPDQFMYDQVKARNEVRRGLGWLTEVSPNGFHYAWDWDGIHFVNLNLFPGDIWRGGADAYGSVHDPKYSLAFLKETLRKHVGGSGRPVVVTHHFRVIDENWWTHSAADEYQKALQDYNVILVTTGHQGGGVNNLWRGINWATSNGVLLVHRITPDNHLMVVERLATGWGTPFRKPIFLSWAASGLPAAVNNGEWAAGITATGATLSGKLLYDAEVPTEVTVFWDTVDGGTSAAAWKNSRSLGNQAAGAAFTAAVSGLKPFTTYHYRMRARNAKGEAWAAASVSFTTQGILPEGWQAAFVGYFQRRGVGAHAAGGAFQLRGSGRDIAEASQPIDNFQFAWRGLEGDGSITAKVGEMTVQTREPKVGVMLRESLSDSARNVAVLVSPNNGVRISHRSRVGGSSETSVANSLRAPCWVRLARLGDTFTASVSGDGTYWQVLGKPVTLAMGKGLLAGLAVTAGNRDGSRLHSATFDNVSVIGNIPVTLLPGIGDAGQVLRLPGLRGGIRVPGRIGALQEVQAFGLDGTRLPAAGGDAFQVLRILGSEGRHPAKAPLR